MRKLFSIPVIALLSLCVSCNDTKTEGGLSAAAQKNIEAFHTVRDAFSNGDTSKINDAVAVDFVDHTERGDMGRDSLKTMIMMVSKSGNTMKAETKKELADDEYVFGWLRWTGTSDGSMGMPAGPFEMNGVEVVRFKDGKAVEHWAFMDPREMMKMMSNMPQQQMPVRDSTKK